MFPRHLGPLARGGAPIRPRRRTVGGVLLRDPPDRSPPRHSLARRRRVRPRGDVVPARQADAAACRGGMLRDEHRMPTVGHLTAAVERLGRDQPVPPTSSSAYLRMVVMPRKSTTARSRPRSRNFARKGCCPIRCSLASNSSIAVSNARAGARLPAITRKHPLPAQRCCPSILWPISMATGRFDMFEERAQRSALAKPITTVITGVLPRATEGFTTGAPSSHVGPH